MLNTDQIQSAIASSIAASAVAFTIWRLCVQRSFLNWMCFAAAVCQSISTATLTIYSYVFGLECKVRYFNLYLFMGVAKIIVYYLYEQRLAMLLQRAKFNPFRWILYFILVCYAGFVVTQVTLNVRDCYSTAAGVATVTSPSGSITKYIMNSFDMLLGATILVGSFYSLGLLMAENRRAGIQSTGIYKIILKSDSFRFFAVFPVEVYKISTSSDASGNNLGFFPSGSGNGNNGFVQLVNAYKIAVMIALLVFPGMFVKAKSASSGAISSLRAGLKSGVQRSGVSTQNIQIASSVATKSRPAADDPESEFAV
ncbi:hypothetical protein HK405_009497 [Cladochytrium tenue]|nr:hypothetical protein HK405_009497 [Cladochytrium tenue]